MFGVLNKFISKLGDEPQAQGSSTPGGSGFQVLSNKIVDFPLEPWFDIIIGINGRTIVWNAPCLYWICIDTIIGQPGPKSVHH